MSDLEIQSIINSILDEYDNSEEPLRCACAKFERSESWFRNQTRKFTDEYERYKQIHKVKQEAKDLRQADMAFRNICKIANGKSVRKVKRVYYDKDGSPAQSYEEEIQLAESLDANLRILDRVDRILGTALPDQMQINLNFMGQDEYNRVRTASGTDGVSLVGTEQPDGGILDSQNGASMGQNDDARLGDA